MLSHFAKVILFFEIHKKVDFISPCPINLKKLNVRKATVQRSYKESGDVCSLASVFHLFWLNADIHIKKKREPGCIAHPGPLNKNQ